MARQRINRRRIRVIRNCYDWLDVLFTVAIVAVSISALMRWPDRFLADLAIPAAVLIVFMMCRAR